MWTAAKQNSCANKFEWCSPKLFFHVNPDLAWKTQQNISPDDKCVTFELDRDAQDGRIGRSNCKKRNRIVCEVHSAIFSVPKIVESNYWFTRPAKKLKKMARKLLKSAKHCTKYPTVYINQKQLLSMRLY